MRGIVCKVLSRRTQGDQLLRSRATLLHYRAGIALAEGSVGVVILSNLEVCSVLMNLKYSKERENIRKYINNITIYENEN